MSWSGWDWIFEFTISGLIYIVILLVSGARDILIKFIWCGIHVLKRYIWAAPWSGTDWLVACTREDEEGGGSQHLVGKINFISCDCFWISSWFVLDSMLTWISLWISLDFFREEWWWWKPTLRREWAKQKRPESLFRFLLLADLIFGKEFFEIFPDRHVIWKGADDWVNKAHGAN